MRTHEIHLLIELDLKDLLIGYFAIACNRVGISIGFGAEATEFFILVVPFLTLHFFFTLFQFGKKQSVCPVFSTAYSTSCLQKNCVQKSHERLGWESLRPRIGSVFRPSAVTLHHSHRRRHHPRHRHHLLRNRGIRRIKTQSQKSSS